MHTAAMVADAYTRTEVQSRSPLELVVMLYDGADKYLSQARQAIEERDAVAKREAISRALAVVSELQNNLNLEAGGEIAASLDVLYSFVNEKLVDANVKNDPSAVEQAIKVIKPLREAWTQLATPAATQVSGGAR